MKLGRKVLFLLVSNPSVRGVPNSVSSFACKRATRGTERARRAGKLGRSATPEIDAGRARFQGLELAAAEVGHVPWSLAPAVLGVYFFLGHSTVYLAFLCICIAPCPPWLFCMLYCYLQGRGITLWDQALTHTKPQRIRLILSLTRCTYRTRCRTGEH